MEGCVKTFLEKKGYSVNNRAAEVIQICDDWYSNRRIKGFHDRRTIQGVEYELSRMNFAKRCCSDDANLCEILEINAGEGGQVADVNALLADSQFNTQYRKQLEKISADGTAACYIRLDRAVLYDDNKVRGGIIKLN